MRMTGEDLENAITNMNILLIELLNQIQGGELYSNNIPMQTY